MADEKPVGQTLSYGLEGTMVVEASFSSGIGGMVHKTTDGGFFYRPGVPLLDQEEIDRLQEPYKTEATEFKAKWEEEHPPEEPVEASADAEVEGEGESEGKGRKWRRSR